MLVGIVVSQFSYGTERKRGYYTHKHTHTQIHTQATLCPNTQMRKQQGQSLTKTNTISAHTHTQHMAEVSKVTRSHGNLKDAFS